MSPNCPSKAHCQTNPCTGGCVPPGVASPACPPMTSCSGPASPPASLPCGSFGTSSRATTPTNEPALDRQEGGRHYKNLKIQPVEYIHANGIGFCEGSAIKYLTRWRAKGGVEDLKKARHFIDLLIEMEAKNP